MIQLALSVSDAGRMLFAGADIGEMVEKYGTPLYLLDEGRIRENMRTQLNAMRSAFGEGSMPTYASKALCFKGLYRIAAQEGIGADVVSGGELYTALAAGFPAEKLFFHGDYKSEDEIALALERGVGFFMADNAYEIETIGRMAGDRGVTANIILRLTPGIDPHTYAAVNTGQIDCQFGTPIETGQAEELVGMALNTANIALRGYHCHLGSQIFTIEPYLLAIGKMTDFIARIKDMYGYEPDYLDLGGGFGVRYVESDSHVDIPAMIAQIGEALTAACAEKGLKKPIVLMEPGRSIVADAGATVYRAGAIKEVRGYRTYVVVDGGMSDNPRYALYKSAYTVYNATRINEKADKIYTVSGRCCESGALLQENVALPETHSGDLIVFGVTGAYNYSMASNYNRLPKLPIVMVNDGQDKLAVRRETYEDMMRNEL